MARSLYCIFNEFRCSRCCCCNLSFNPGWDEVSDRCLFLFKRNVWEPWLLIQARCYGSLIRSLGMVGVWHFHSNRELLVCVCHFGVNNHEKSGTFNIYDPSRNRNGLLDFDRSEPGKRRWVSNQTLLQSRNGLCCSYGAFTSNRTPTRIGPVYCHIYTRKQSEIRNDKSMVDLHTFCIFWYHARHSSCSNKSFTVIKMWCISLCNSLLGYRYTSNFSASIPILTRNLGYMGRSYTRSHFLDRYICLDI